MKESKSKKEKRKYKKKKKNHFSTRNQSNNNDEKGKDGKTIDRNDDRKIAVVPETATIPAKTMKK